LRRTGIIEVVAYTLCALVARQPVGVVLREIAQWPFNQVLRRLGVLRGEAIDEFDAVGLNRHRSTDDWVKIAAR